MSSVRNRRLSIRFITLRAVMMVSCLLALFPVSASYSPHAEIALAQDFRLVRFRVIIERVVSLNSCIPSCTDLPDFYAVVTLEDFGSGEKEFVSPAIPNDEDISPAGNLGWEFATFVELSNSSANAVIEIWDDNSEEPLHTPPTPVTIHPFPTGGSHGVGFRVNINECRSGTPGAVSGFFGTPGNTGSSWNCNETLSSAPPLTGGGALINFRVVIEPPPSTPGTNVRCIHDPIWPQATDVVTFNADALDGYPVPKWHNIEISIWLENSQEPLAFSNDQASLSTAAGPFPDGSSPAYGCLVRDLTTGEEKWSGWRHFQVGLPAQGQAVPILNNGPQESSIDIVFIGDHLSYPGIFLGTQVNDPNFFNDVRKVIIEQYYAKRTPNTGIFLFNQELLNFWIALDSGYAFGNEDDCALGPPTNWNTDYAFADAGVILHRDSFRDCAIRAQRVLASNATDDYTILHETGHVPFGLSDEYSGDANFFQLDPYPNMYRNQADCLQDPLANGVDNACQLITTTSEVGSHYRLDPASTYHHDLMVADGYHIARPADERRINWLFDTCRGGECSRSAPVSVAAIQAQGPHDQPLPVLDLGDSTKVMVVAVNYNQAGKVDTTSVQIVPGVPPARFSAAPQLEVHLENNTGQVVEEFPDWNPLLGDSETLASNTGRYIFPFTPDLKTLTVIDTYEQQEMAQVDLKPAINQFCDENFTSLECAVDSSVAISGSTPRVAAGSNLTYTVAITNNGLVAASGAVVTQTLPHNASYVSSGSSPVCSGADGLVICNIGVVSHTTTLTLPIIVTIARSASVQDTLVSTATLYAKQVDPDLSNNISIVSTSVISPTALDETEQPERLDSSMFLPFIDH